MSPTLAIAAVVAGVLASSAEAAPVAPTLPQQFFGKCNQTLSNPFGMPMNIVGPCWWDFDNKKSRQDGNMNTPFGSMPGSDIHWYAQTYHECVAVMGSTCSYMNSAHTHSIDYSMSTFFGQDQCSFTWKEAADDPLYPLVIPPGSTFAPVNGGASDQWSWTMGNAAGSVTYTTVVKHSDPTTIERIEILAGAGGFKIDMNIDFLEFTAGSIDPTVFNKGISSACKETKNNDD